MIMDTWFGDRLEYTGLDVNGFREPVSDDVRCIRRSVYEYSRKMQFEHV